MKDGGNQQKLFDDLIGQDERAYKTECPACGYGLDDLRTVKVGGRQHRVHNDVVQWMLDHVGIHVRIKSEIKHGVSRWIYDNWHKLGEIKCDCGSRIDYGTARATGELRCKKCAA